MARTDPQLNFRIPAELKARLEDAAVKNQRTLTGELIARLEQSFDTRDTDLAQDTVGAMLKSLSMTITHAEHLAKRLELIEKKRS